MSPDIEGLSRAVERNKRLEIRTRAYDGNGYASLGLDLRVLTAVFETIGIAEVAATYWGYGQMSFPTGFEKPLPGLSLALFDRSVSAVDRSTTWVDALANQEDWLDLYKQQFFFPRRAYWAVGNGKILRVELVELSKENPTVTKIIVSGFTAATLFLATCFGGVHLVKTIGEERCRQDYFDYSNRQTEIIMTQAKLEGRFTRNHEVALGRIQNSLKAGIAACTANMDEIDVTLGDQGVVVSVSRAEHRASNQQSDDPSERDPFKPHG
jgi:hypothetical protein